MQLQWGPLMRDQSKGAIIANLLVARLESP